MPCQAGCAKPLRRHAALHFGIALDHCQAHTVAINNTSICSPSSAPPINFTGDRRTASAALTMSCFARLTGKDPRPKHFHHHTFRSIVPSSVNRRLPITPSVRSSAAVVMARFRILWAKCGQTAHARPTPRSRILRLSNSFYGDIFRLKGVFLRLTGGIRLRGVLLLRIGSPPPNHASAVTVSGARSSAQVQTPQA